MASADVGTLRTRLSFEDEGNSGGLTGFKRDLKGLRSEMNLAKSGGRDYSKSLKGLGEQSDILTRRFKTQKAEVAELKKRYDESVRVKGEDHQTTKDLAAQYNNTTAQMNRTENQLKALNAEIKRLESPWTQIGEKMTATGEKMEKFGKGMTDFGKSYSKRVTAPILAGGAAAFKVAIDYESAFAGVRKTVDMTEVEFESLSDSIRGMAKEIPATTTEIAAITEAAGQLGIKNEALVGFTRTMADLGVATTMSSDQAATALARLANITGMNQQDFDRLGSSVVHLGNNFAATEEEIVEMALRLAGAGDQIGMSEADILGLSAALTSVGIKAEMGGSAMSRVMVRMQLATSTGFKEVQAVLKETGHSLRDLEMMASHDSEGFGAMAHSLGMTKKELLDLIKAGNDMENFSKIAGMTSDQFKKAFEDDAVGALGKFIEGLGNAEDAGESAINMLQEMGITEIRLRDSLLRAGNASELFADAVDLSNVAWKENTALTEEAEERYKTMASQMKVLWNRIKDVGINLGNSLIPALSDAFDAAEPFIRQIESGAKAFSEMDQEQQRTILKLLALVAAVGPASVVLGGLTTTIGGVLKVGGGLATMLGTPTDAGLVSRIAVMGAKAGPVGLAAVAVGGLAYGLYKLNEANKESTSRALESIQARKEELDATDDLIASFEELQKKNKLSTDEVLRYMDIMSELKDAKSEQAIKALTDEQEKLLKKSGLTNDEMTDFLAINGEIVEKSPETVKAVSDLGNAYAENLDKLKELNAYEREMLTFETWETITKEMDKQTANLEKQSSLAAEIYKATQDKEEIDKDIIKNNGIITDAKLEIARLEREGLTASEDRKLVILDELGILDEIVSSGQRSNIELEHSKKNLLERLAKNKENLAETNKEIKAFKELTDEYAEMILYEQGITTEKGKHLEAIEREQKAIDVSRKKLEEKNKTQELGPGIYEEELAKIEEQQRKIDGVKEKLAEANELAGKKIYKGVEVTTNPSIAELNRRLSTPIHRNMNVKVSTHGASQIAYADGTSNHRGGPFIAGEEGYELGRMGNRWEMLNFGMYDRPAGYEVFTHDETKSIIGALNRMPGYATGVSSPGESSRVVGQLNSSDGYETVVVLKEQNKILLQLLEKENVAVVEFESVYQPVKRRLNEDNYSSRKQRRA